MIFAFIHHIESVHDGDHYYWDKKLKAGVHDDDGVNHRLCSCFDLHISWPLIIIHTLIWYSMNFLYELKQYCNSSKVKIIF